MIFQNSPLAQTLENHCFILHEFFKKYYECFQIRRLHMKVILLRFFYFFGLVVGCWGWCGFIGWDFMWLYEICVFGIE